MVHGRHLQSIDCGINDLHRAAADVLLETIQVSEKCVREDVLLRTAREQKRFDFGAPFRSCRGKRRYENKGLDRRRRIQTDPGI
jgi:hypothetical protein